LAVLHRRTFLTGLAASLIAAPAIVRAASLMPVRGIVQPTTEDIYKLLAQRIHDAQEIMKQNLAYALYGDPLNPQTVILTPAGARKTMEQWPYKSLAYAIPVLDTRTLS
jgi:hypothetical protein